jgi:ADP-heptose:LPS heptosyltransferase
MAKSKTFGKMKFFASSMMPVRWRNAMLTWILRTWYRPPELVFPWNNQALKKALVILPEDPVEAFHQINNYLRITGHYRNASFYLFCTGKVGAFFKHVHPEATIIEYEPSERFLFSRQFEERGKFFSREEFDLCLVLEHSPDMSMLYLAGKTSALIRAGYTEAGEFPFLNMHVNPSREQRYRAEQNAVMARALGASEERAMHWSVSKETMEEISHMFQELKIPLSARLIGLDAGLFFRVFGQDWIEMLWARLRDNKIFTFYWYVGEEPDEALSSLLSSLGVPVFSNLSAPRSAALIGKSVGVVSGKSIFFELANMMRKPVLGIFEENERALYCQTSALTTAATYSGAPDSGVVDKVVLFVHSLSAARKE